MFAVDAVGNTSAAGVTASVTARDQLAPAVPAGLAATPGDGTVDLRWAPAGADDDVAGYVLVAKAGQRGARQRGRRHARLRGDRRGLDRRARRPG